MEELRVILPTNIKKYTGNIKKKKDEEYITYFKDKYDIFVSYNDAFKWLKEQNCLEEYGGMFHNIRNIILYNEKYDITMCTLCKSRDYHEILNKNHLLYIDKESIGFINEYNLFITSSSVISVSNSNHKSFNDLFIEYHNDKKYLTIAPSPYNDDVNPFIHLNGNHFDYRSSNISQLII